MAHKFTDLQEKWLTALESGEYQQGREALLCDGKYCCLGVGASVLGFHTKRTGDGFLAPNGRCLEGCLEFGTYQLLGLRDWDGSLDVAYEVDGIVYGSLVTMNDSCDFTFAEIAAYIRANPENVFVEEECPN